MIRVLENILLCDNVKEEFDLAYKDEHFRGWITTLIPEVEAARKQKQDNPWHIYNCLDHILHSVEKMNELTKEMPSDTRLLLAYTMFFHDLGKPKCHIRRFSKLYQREVDSFFNHPLVSAEIFNRVKDALEIDKEMQPVIHELITYHDAFMNIRLDTKGGKYKALTKEVVDDFISKFDELGNGKKLFSYLVMVSRADNLAQNPSMTQESLQVLDEIEKILKINARKSY